MFLFIRPSFVANPQAAGRLIPPSPIFGRGEALGVAVAQNRQVNALPQPSVPLPLGLEGWTGKAQVCCIQNVGAKAERKQKCAGGESLCAVPGCTQEVPSLSADSFPVICTAGGGHTHTHLESAARSPQPAQALRAPPRGCPPGNLRARPRLLDRRRSCMACPGRPRGARGEKRGPGERRTRSQGRALVPNPRSRPRAVTTPPAPGTG